MVPHDSATRSQSDRLPSNYLPLLQRPWAQTVLPLLTSLAIHAAILVAAVAVVAGGGQVYRRITSLETQAVAADTAIVVVGPPGGVQFRGFSDDPTRPPTQDVFPDGGNGWAAAPGARTAAPALLGGGDVQAHDPVIGFSSGGGGFQSGAGDPFRPGASDGGGALAPFGSRAGGDVDFMGVAGSTPAQRRVNSVVFVCDASGSMINTFASLKQQLVRSIGGLKPVQSFNLVFFQDEKCRSLGDGLLPATADNKSKAFKWLDEQTTTGTTDPIPGLEAAFKARPDLVYLLTDADFPDNDSVKHAIERLNKDRRTRINTIIFEQDRAGYEGTAAFTDLMKDIAKTNGGVFAHVKESNLK
jgi:hypothetical protein